jgi:hypothetical protein
LVSWSEAQVTFSYRKPITIQSSQVSGTANLTNFPVLINISGDNDLKTDPAGNVLHPSGYDIVFYDGTDRLDFEIEHYDGTAGDLIAWVRIPDLPYDTDHTIYIYYGSSAVTTPQETPCAVWDEDYVGVWHLTESGDGSKDEFPDSSKYANHGQGGEGKPLYVPGQVAGQIGYGQDFAISYNYGDASVSLGSDIVTLSGGSPPAIPLDIQFGDTIVIDPGGPNEETFTVQTRDSNTQLTVTTTATIDHVNESYVLYNKDERADLIDCGDDVTLDQIGDQITLEAWIRHNVLPHGSISYGILNHKGYYDGYALLFPHSRVKPTLHIPGQTDELVATNDTPTNTWQHVVATYDGSMMRLYIDGSLDVQSPKTGTITPTSSQTEVWIGHADQQADKLWSGPWYGQLDEARISKVARSADWIATEHNNQSSPATFYTVSPQEAGGSLGTLQINYRSIGDNVILYDVDSASATNGSATVAFSGATPPVLPANIGAGDKLILDPFGTPTTYFILSRDSDIQVTLQSAATADYSGVYEIRRAFTTLQDWETTQGGDLVGDNRREVGLIYESLDSAVDIAGSITDCVRFMQLSVHLAARHDGTAGSGVVLDPSAAGTAVTVQTDYTRIDGLEITGWTGADSEAVRINAQNTTFSHMIVHGAADTDTDGFYLVPNQGDWLASIRNTIIYDVGRAGVHLENNAGTAYLTYRLDNVTIYGCGGSTGTASFGGGTTLCEVEGTVARIQARNTISMSNVDDDGDGDADFNIASCALYNTDTATVAAGNNVVTFSGGTPPSLPNDIGYGDKLILEPGGGNEEIFWVQSRDSATQVTVQSNASLPHTNVAYTFERGNWRYAHWTPGYNLSSDGSASGTDWYTGTTDAVGNTGVTVVMTGASFIDWDVVAGDWFNNDTDGTSSRIASVDTNEQLTLVETGVTGNSKVFSINKSGYYRDPANEFALPGSNFHLRVTAAAIDSGLDLSSHLSQDIDGEARPAGAAWDIGADEWGATTSVEIVSFDALGRDSEILLAWETGSEVDNLGFHLYRALSSGGPYERITSTVIPGLGSSPEGQQYSYTDTGLTNGVTYYYKLEDVETTGKTEEHGPVWATPRATEESKTEEGSGEEETSSSARTTVGRPELNRLSILESRTGELVLELITEGFYAIPQDDGTVRLEIPEFTLTEDAGSPAMPVRRSWVPVLAGQQVNLVSVTTFDEEIFEGLLPETAGAPAIEVGRGGTVRATRQRRQRVKHRGETYYPEQSAQLLGTAFQEDVKKALVEMAPLRWDTTQNRLVLAHRLVVRLSLEGRDLAEQTSRGGRRGRRYPRPPLPQEPSRIMTRWVTTEAGLYGVDLSRLLRSRDGTPTNPDVLRLSRQGETVPFHIEDSTLYFVSVGGEGNPYGHEAVYELVVGVSGERMAISSAVPGGAPTPYYWERIRQEEDLIYQSALVQAPDRWLWKMLFAPARESLSFDVSALAASPEASRLKVWLQGASDFAADPDHHVQVYVNGTFVGETRWNGKEAEELDLEIVAGILREGENVIEVENVDDTEATYSMVMLNRFEVRYPRRLEGLNGQLQGRWSLSGTADVSGVGADALVLQQTPSGFTWLEGSEATVSGVRFQAEAGHDYLVVSPAAVRTPTTRRVSPSSRLKTTSQQADYVLIGPREFLGAASSLLELRRSQGLRAKAVAIEDIYSEFGFGEENPQALKDFLTYAYHSWNPGPRYVVLAGDGTYDFKDNLGTGVPNQVPPMMVLTSYLETASDAAYAAVNGEDLLPDLAIGRLPAATVDELQRMVTKIVAFETSGNTFGGRAVLVSDNPDRAGDFVANAETLAATVLDMKEVEKIYLSQLGATATRSQIQQAFNDGASLMNYIGHGGIHLWADENIFNNDDVQTLALQYQQPLLLTMNCLNGYFHFPYLNALSEELLKAEGKGAVAAFSPSGLSVNSAAHIFHRLLLEELVSGEHARLGDAVLAAQSAYADLGALPEMIAIYHLFGDPAMGLQ